MEEIKCGILQGETLGKAFYMINAEILEGSLAEPVGLISSGIWLNEQRLGIPVSFLKLGTDFNRQLKLYVDIRLCPDNVRPIITDTKSGTLRMQQPDQTVALEGRKQLLFIDDSGVLPALPSLLGLARSGAQIEVFRMNASDKAASNALRNYIKRMDFSIRSIRGGGEQGIAAAIKEQTIGTRIMAFCDWRDFSRIKRIARQSGYANEEFQGIGIGEKEERVFCAHCYEMQPKPNGSEMDCVRCGSPLLISNHYSPRLEAFMGYVNVNE
ncbi:dimethylamine monooxygenase subunit DmmA family protein [Paenibacillus beijingensis]|uniref:Dimethylamine monooxygenase subunit DmmA-like C-terminal domain-containing protein n=1 Tax=Paenibacillus beijingensis TaxID=1126833 RepID=A0A0D5NEY6_9BACL|nr:dimethylamine monooxygenase subunit DmmA family protein [Paenibacillus beijingensis]AJY73483.1 hypothetical protein VN24_01150 [Paenibacillus beijingensis]